MTTCVHDNHYSTMYYVITGSMRNLDVIDVSRQDDLSMKMREWVQYYEGHPRSKILNVISLEFSDTRYVHVQYM